jgi:hypothetical protein
MHEFFANRWGIAFVLGSIAPALASAQFADDFSSGSLSGWTYFTGDGEAEIEFKPRDGYASSLVTNRTSGGR